MIVPMKKLAVVVMESDRETAVERMREAGVLHLESGAVQSDEVAKLEERIGTIERARALLPPEDERTEAQTAAAESAEAQQIAARLAEDTDGEAGYDQAESLVAEAERRRELREQRDKIDRELLRLEPWGEVDSESIRELEQYGIVVRLYQLSPDEFQALECAYAFAIGRSKDVVRFAVVVFDESELPETEPVPLPEHGSATLRRKRDELTEQIGEIDRKFGEIAAYEEHLKRAGQLLSERLEFERVRAGMAGEAGVAYITGFIPEPEVKSFRKLAAREGWGLMVRDPGPDDSVPTLVRNPKPVRIIQPVFKLIATVPGYRELDISLLFLVFFTVFFAMILSDAGYGVIVFAGAVAAARHGKRRYGQVSEGNVLLLLLSAATVIWGTLTGNWFGYEPFAELPVLSGLVIEPISTWNPASADNVQLICFVLGTLQLTIAHLWNFIRKFHGALKTRLRAFTEIGWLLIVLGLFYLVLALVIDPDRFPVPTHSLWMVAIGLVVVFLCSQQEDGVSFAVGVGRGFANFLPNFLDSISAFSDIISYIRLFAVGLATVEIANAFNNMAGDLSAGVGGVIGIVAAVVVLFIGHTLNLLMAALAVIVHGVRLNMLEFSSHLGMEWSGFPYRPFQKQFSMGREER